MNLSIISMLIPLIILSQLALAANCPDGITKRKEVNDLTEAEWQIFTSTIKQADSILDPDSGNTMSIWKYYSSIHSANQMPIHNNNIFLPLHRKFLRDIELKLQKINPAFAMHYWDSGIYAWNATSSAHWKYFGTTGTPLAGDLFGGAPMPYNGLLRPLFRTYSSLSPPAATLWDGLYQESLLYGGFEHYAPLMESIHNSLHSQIGGDMNSMSSPSDPLFYLHHGHIDFLWSKAQIGFSVKNVSQFGGVCYNNQACSASTPLPIFNVPVGDVLEISNMCYTYVPASQRRAIDATPFSCPPPLSPETLQMNKGNPNFLANWERMQSTCSKVQSILKAGSVIPVAPQTISDAVLNSPNPFSAFETEKTKVSSSAYRIFYDAFILSIVPVIFMYLHL